MTDRYHDAHAPQPPSHRDLNEAELRSMVDRSGLEMVDGVMTGSDACGKPVLVSAGKLLSDPRLLREMNKATEAMQKCANLARENAKLREELAQVARDQTETSAIAIQTQVELAQARSELAEARRLLANQDHAWKELWAINEKNIAELRLLRGKAIP